MKLIKSKCIQKCEGRKKGKYLVTLEITDYDLEKIEDLATVYCNKEEVDLYPEYSKWLYRVWKALWTLWRDYDDDGEVIK